LFKNLKAYEIPEHVGSLGVLFWALSTLLIVTSIVYQFSTLTGIPLLSTMIIGAYFMNINRINDNHAIRLKKPDHSIRELHKKDYQKLPELQDKFEEWINTPFTLSTENRKEIPNTIYELAEEYKGICEFILHLPKEAAFTQLITLLKHYKQLPIICLISEIISLLLVRFPVEVLDRLFMLVG